MTDEDARAELEQRCGGALRRVADLAKPQDSEWLTLDLGMGQFKAMVVLIKHKQLTVGGLARALNISEPSASLVVDKLVTRGLVERNTDVADRRRTLVVPTDEGNRLLERLRRTQQDQLSGWLGLVHERDLRALVRGLDALADAIEHERSQA